MGNYLEVGAIWLRTHLQLASPVDRPLHRVVRLREHVAVEVIVRATGGSLSLHSVNFFLLNSEKIIDLFLSIRNF